MAQTYYEILGVASNATAAEIEAAFKARAREVHPDRVEPGSPYLQRVAAEAFKDLAEAKSILLDPVKRQKYDLELAYRRSSEQAYTPPVVPCPTENTPPAAETPQRRQSTFWKQSSARFSSAMFVALGLGAVLILGGLIWSGKTPPFWIVVIVMALALLSWRQGMRPSENATVSGASVFFLLCGLAFAAILFAYWFRPAPSDRESSPATATHASTGQAVPKAADAPILAPRRSVSQRVIIEEPNVAATEANGNVVTRIWKNRTDGQAYRTRLTGDALYLEVVGSPAKSVSGIESCEFHRAASAGQQWSGMCWERKPNDPGSHQSSATVTLSDAQILGSTSDITEFVMTAVESIQIGTAGAQLSQQMGASQNGQAEQSRLTDSERQSVESACSYAKLMQGPAEYNRCLEKQIAALRAVPRPPDLSRSGLSSTDRESIESACSNAKFIEGPAAYNQCLSRQLELLRKRR